MNVYVAPPKVKSPSIHRVAHALVRYAPAGVETVPFQEIADLVVLHVVGRQDQVLSQAEKLLERGQRYAVIQYCLKSTMRPEVAGWLPLWHRAVTVWSYYDLPTLCRMEDAIPGFDFYRAPLGVDPAVFAAKRPTVPRPFLICTSGYGYLTESVRECIQAARAVGRPVFHLGPDLQLHAPDVVCKSGLTDVEVAAMYAQCEFVSGLRRTEGFELPAAEGLLCGCRPILFDRDHYRHWYDGWAEYIPEGDRPDVTASLVRLFEAGARPVAWDEWETAKSRFDWQTIIAGFWERCQL